MSKENTSVGDVLGTLREFEMQKEADFVKQKAKLEALYEKKQSELSNSLIDYETKQKNQYELHLKDAKLLAKKEAKASVSTAQKDYAAQIKDAKANVDSAKKLVMANLV